MTNRRLLKQSDGTGAVKEFVKRRLATKLELLHKALRQVNDWGLHPADYTEVDMQGEARQAVNGEQSVSVAC